MTLEQVASELGKSFEDVLIDDIGPRGASAAYFVMDQELQDGTTNIDDLKEAYLVTDKTDAKSRYTFDKVRDLYQKLSPAVQETLKQQVINKNVNKIMINE